MNPKIPPDPLPAQSPRKIGYVSDRLAEKSDNKKSSTDPKTVFTDFASI